MAFTTTYVKNINRTPVLGLAMASQVELLEAGLCEPVQLVSGADEAIIGWEGDRAIGAITFQHTEWAKQFDILMGYVAPDMRGRCVYRTMWNSLVAAARDRDVHVIMGNTDIRNRRMLDVAVALGRQSIAVILKYEIKE